MEDKRPSKGGKRRESREEPIKRREYGENGREDDRTEEVMTRRDEKRDAQKYTLWLKVCRHLIRTPISAC